jgi:trehalose/maltose hydrolase-like predicted phosphorylase
MEKITISKNAITDLPREVQCIRIEFLDFQKKEAKILFECSHKNITAKSFTFQKWVIISNTNTVTDQGQNINRTQFPQLPDESDADYQIRYDNLLANGNPEFDFWWENAKIVNLEEAIKNGILLLDSLNFFDE